MTGESIAAHVEARLAPRGRAGARERALALTPVLNHVFRRLVHQHFALQPVLEECRLYAERGRRREGDRLSLRVRLSLSNDTHRWHEHRVPRTSLFITDPVFDALLEADADGRGLAVDAREVWSRLFEDEYMRRSAAAQARQMMEAMAGLPPEYIRPAEEIQERIRAVMALQEHVATHHEPNGGPVVTGVDPAAGPDWSQPLTADILMRYWDENAGRLRSFYCDLFLQQPQAEGSNVGTWGDPFGSPEVGSDEARQRGLELLLENLSPEQRAQYDTHKHFDVKGGTSGRTYRIHHGRQMNIARLDEKGQPVQGVCFLPQGGLVEGDCMLAQKAALEVREAEALKIANRFPIPPGSLLNPHPALPGTRVVHESPPCNPIAEGRVYRWYGLSRLRTAWGSGIVHIHPDAAGD